MAIIETLESLEIDPRILETIELLEKKLRSAKGYSTKVNNKIVELSAEIENLEEKKGVVSGKIFSTEEERQIKEATKKRYEKSKRKSFSSYVDFYTKKIFQIERNIDRYKHFQDEVVYLIEEYYGKIVNYLGLSDKKAKEKKEISKDLSDLKSDNVSVEVKLLIVKKYET